MEINTFSIVGRCGRTGQVGGAVASAGPGVGPMCLFARSGVGAVSSQSWCNPYLAYDGLDLMEQGMSPQELCDKLLAEDPGREIRQIGYVDAKGRSAAFTGKDCAQWNGHITGPDFSSQGNLLVGGDTVKAMAETFQRLEALDLAERLIAALEAGDAAGGDARGKQGAAVLVMHKERYPLVDLRADEHRHPVVELRRVYEVARYQSLPFVAQMPTRDNPLGSFAADMAHSMSVAPAYRPGGGGGESA
jgi:uncharacterized Ntn-hydrolase superfamily protein